MTSSALPITRKRQARAVATREALLDAALGEFAAHGFEGASTRAIAAAAGTHQPQINYHFESKDALWKAAVDHLFVRLDRAIGDASFVVSRVVPDNLDVGGVDGATSRVSDSEHASASDLDPRVAFAGLLRTFVRAVAGLPELNRIMVQEATIDSERLQWIVERHTRPRFDLVTEHWRRLRAAGLVADLDEVVVYYSLIGAASLAYVNAPEARLLGHDTSTESFVEAHADALVRMVLGPEGVSR